MKSRKKINILIALLFVVFVFAPFYSTSAIEYGGIGGRPAYPRPDNPRTESIFVHNASYGDVIDEAVRVINNTDEVKTLSIYGGDYIPSSGGGFACRQFAEEQTQVGSWMKFDKQEVVLYPKTNEVIPFTISIPEDAGVGENNGCVLIEEKQPDASDEQASGVNLRFRTGLRVAITIPGEISKKMNIVDFSVSRKTDNNILLKAQIHNAGNVSIDSDVKIKTKNILNQEIASHGGEFSILRGQTSDYNFELKQPYWGGVFVSRLTVAYDPSVSTELGKQSQEKRVVLSADKVIFFSPPHPKAATVEILILLALLIFVVYSIKKKKRQKWMSRGWVRYSVKKGDNIHNIAESRKVGWKMIAQANHLAPPYYLEAGSMLKVPPSQDIFKDFENKKNKTKATGSTRKKVAKKTITKKIKKVG